ncbi:MAG: nuclear transport factor 2 family protein [Sphingobium sp.]|uniref:YybH family protein n=1 Tax=Sphingobium sp. CECT 9361 TaxID=2845384 RepID=UPI001E4ACBA2|nr:nuclear transport factor 2 family protein [Sphingobium sp. CECT 9361]CAH0355627.1 hypothetical protein SPH9361_03657 [Sphingobium sp. CECT 9361]
MKTKYTAGLIPITLAFAATGVSAEVPGSAGQKELVSAHAAWLARVNANDQVEGVKDFTDDALIVGGEGPIVEGRDAVRDYVAILGGRPGFNVAFDLERATVSSDGAIGYVIGSAMITSLDSNKRRVGGRVRLLTVWRKIDGVWKCYIDAPLSVPS